MSTFTLASSCLTISNLLWFMDVTFQVPMQYCSLQHWTLLPSPVTSTTRHFCFGSVSSFFPELFLCWSPVTYWAPTDLGSSPFCVLSFYLFILFMGFSRQEYWSGLPWYYLGVIKVFCKEPQIDFKLGFAGLVGSIINNSFHFSGTKAVIGIH